MNNVWSNILNEKKQCTSMARAKLTKLLCNNNILCKIMQNYSLLLCTLAHILKVKPTQISLPYPY